MAEEDRAAGTRRVIDAGGRALPRPYSCDSDVNVYSFVLDGHGPLMAGIVLTKLNPVRETPPHRVKS